MGSIQKSSFEYRIESPAEESGSLHITVDLATALEEEDRLILEGFLRSSGLGENPASCLLNAPGH